MIDSQRVFRQETVGDIDCDGSSRRIPIADTSDLSDNESSGLTNGVDTEAEGAGMLRLTASSRVPSTRFGAPTKRAIHTPASVPGTK
jgi:hypothetical protein